MTQVSSIRQDKQGLSLPHQAMNSSYASSCASSIGLGAPCGLRLYLPR